MIPRAGISDALSNFVIPLPPLQLPRALGGLINMTKECHFGKFMEQQALRCRYFAGGCKVADGQDNIYDAV